MNPASRLAAAAAVACLALPVAGWAQTTQKPAVPAPTTAPKPAAPKPAAPKPAAPTPTARQPTGPAPAPAAPTPSPDAPAPSADAPAPSAEPAPSSAPPSASEGATPEPPADEHVMTEHTRPMWFSVGFGPSVGIVGCVRRLCNTEQSYTQFKVSEDFGFHVSGSDGFAIGANLQQAFGNDVYRFSGAFKMWWDAPLTDDLALFLTPTVHAGYSLLYFDFGDLGTIVDHAFNAQAGLGLRMVLLDRVLLYVRPITADVLIGEDGVALFYDIAVGGGVTF